MIVNFFFQYLIYFLIFISLVFYFILQKQVLVLGGKGPEGLHEALSYLTDALMTSLLWSLMQRVSQLERMLGLLQRYAE